MTGLTPDIQAIFEKSRAIIDQRVEALEQAVSALIGGNLGEDQRAAAERDAHKLAGSLGMFGFPQGTGHARELERALALPGGPAAGETPRLAELVVEMRAELDASRNGHETTTLNGQETTGVGNGNGNGNGEGAPVAGRSLLVVSSDPELSEDLTVEALGKNLRPRSTTTCSGARRLVAEEAPDAAVLDVAFGEDHRDSLTLLEELTHREPPVSVLALTRSEALVDRVEVARRGGRGFMHRDLPAARVVDAVNEQLDRAKPAEAKVLAVDDDPAISEVVTALLAAQGLDVTPLNDPQRFWELLESTTPDLLLLDLDMPGLDGIDLCRAVRADARFGQLPIIFLTVCTDTASVQKIFEAGADDFVAKPIVGPELTMRVLNRIERVRLYRDMAEKDGLTGLASRRGSTAAIEDQLALAIRSGQPASLALVDMDRLKDVNASLGHAAGDAALRRFGEILGQSFRGQDVVARWGHGEFVVATYGMACDDGVQRIAEVLETFRQEQSTGHDGRSGGITFSAGVAEYPRDGADLHQLYQAASQALERAKEVGRDRVLPSASLTDVETQSLDVVVVDDDEALGEILMNSLETRGYRAQLLTDGQEAIERLSGATPELTPSLIMLDVDLPGLDGLSVLRRLAADDVLSSTRVIMLTARAGETEVVAALELGAFDHVAKPFSLPVLMQRVRRALRR